MRGQTEAAGCLQDDDGLAYACGMVGKGYEIQKIRFSVLEFVFCQSMCSRCNIYSMCNFWGVCNSGVCRVEG